MTLRRYRCRWYDSREGDWQDITMLSNWESDCVAYVVERCPYMFRKRCVNGVWEDSLQAFLLSEIVLPYVLTYE